MLREQLNGCCFHHGIKIIYWQHYLLRTSTNHATLRMSHMLVIIIRFSINKIAFPDKIRAQSFEARDLQSRVV